jgi:hypothetical protein
MISARERYFNIIDAFLKQMRSKGKQALDACDVKSALITEQVGISATEYSC